MINLFGKTKKLELDVKNYLYIIQKTGLIFNEAINEYIECEYDDFDKRVTDINELESEADAIKRNIKNKLYKNMLIPDARGDVWELIELLDRLIGVVEKVLENFSFEHPYIPEFIKKHFIKIADYSQKTTDEVVNAVSAYFNNFTMVTDFINKIMFYEHEIDKIEDLLKKTIFSSDELKKLSHRIQLRYFIEQMALLSDFAERIAEKLSILVIKREI